MKQNKIPRNEYIIKPKGKTNPYKHDVVYTNLGQWKYPGQVTKIPSNQITMQGVNYPVHGIDDTGYSQMMYPGMDYTFPGQYVTEYPMAQNGAQVEDNDSWLENIAEIVDPTGISSWDDIYRAYKNSGVGKELALESLGAIPFLGKISKLTEPGIHLIKYSGIDKILRNTLPRNKSLSRAADVAFKTGKGTDAVQAVLGAKDDSGFTWDLRHGEVPKYGGRNIFPQIDLGEHGDYAYGGSFDMYPFGGIHTKTHTHMATGGWLDTMQVGGRAPIYVNDPNDPLLRAYQDSLAINKTAKNAWHYGDTRVSKAEFDKKELEHDAWPEYWFAERKYDIDKKAHKFKNFDDYIVKTTAKDLHTADSPIQKIFERDVFSASEHGYSKDNQAFTEKLPSGKTRTYYGLLNGKPNKSYWEEYDPLTHTTSRYSEKLHDDKVPTLLGVENPHMKPVSTDYWAYKTKHPTSKISTSSLKEESTDKKITFRDKSSKEYQNYTWGTTENPQYKAPVQPVIYMPKKYNPNDPRLAAGKKVFEDVFNKPLPKKVIKKPVDTPKQLPKKSEVITPEYLPMIQASMPDMISQEPDITPNFTFPKQSNVNNRIGWRMDPETRKMVPVYLEGMKQKVKEGKRLYNKEIPTSTMGIPKDFEPQFDGPESFEKTDPYWRREYVNPKTVAIKKQFGGWLDEYQDGGDNENSVINMLSKNTLAKGERSNQDNTRVSKAPIKTLQALQAQAQAEKAARYQATEQPVLSQGKKLNPSEQAYSDKVKARIANPSNDLGITAANMASALTRFRYLNPEEIAATTNNPSATVGLASNIMTEALANEMAGPALGKAFSSGAKNLAKKKLEKQAINNFQPQNLDIPPPPSYDQYAASNLDPVSQRVWQQQPILDDFIITPETRGLMNFTDPVDIARDAWHNNDRFLTYAETHLLDREGLGNIEDYLRPNAPINTGYTVPDINSPYLWSNFETLPNKPVNRSGLTKEEALERFAGTDKEAISKMSEKDFKESVMKPTGEIVPYKLGPEVNQMGYNTDLRTMQLKDAIPMSNEEYRNMFNERLDLLNDIIAKNNKSGVNYTSKGLNEYNQLVFETPEQLVKKQLTEKQIANIEKFNKNPKETLIELGNFRKGKNGKWESDIDHETFDNIEDAVTYYTPLLHAEIGPQTIKGTSLWDIGINPGQWRGDIEDIANGEYYKSIPGLDMRNTSSSVFADRIPRRGTGTYESINEYLKGLDLGRVKPGFNSQSDFSKGLWENNIKKGKAFGFYNDKNTVYGAMKSALPYVGTGALGAAALQQEKLGGLLDEYQDGGNKKIKISDKRTIRGTTGKTINPNKDLKTGYYDKTTIDSIAENATRRGIDPYQAIAMSLVESNLGKTDPNVGHVLNFNDSVSPYKQMMDKILSSQATAKRLNKKSPAEIIQAYNGYGKLYPSTEKDYHGFKASSFYGVPVTEKGLNMKENPLYGKEVLDIQKNIIEKDPNIKDIVTSYQYPRVKGYAKDWNDFLPHVAVDPKELTEENLNKENLKAFLGSKDQFKRGGQKGLKKYTSKNVYTSVNDIMLRNETLFGPAGKKRYKPNLKYKDGGWLDNMY